MIYAPTFRKDETEFEKYLNDLIDNIDLNKYNLIIKLHPLSKVEITNDKVIADKLISEYSCVIYEAGVRNIPLYFYAYDLDNYETVRGLALDYNELPGYTEKDASKLCKSLDKKYDKKELKDFINKYVENTKECTKKIASLVKEKMQ